MVDKWRNLSSREQNTLLIGGLIIITIALFFFVIEPMKKQTKEMQSRLQTRQQQTIEMQGMVEELLANKPGIPSVEGVLEPYLATQTLEDGKTILMTKTMGEVQAKQLFLQIYKKGRTKIIKQGNLVVLWHQLDN